MASDAELVVGLVEIARAQNKFGLAIALESGARHDIEDTVGPVAELRTIAAAADFEIIDIFRIELRPEIRCDVGVGDGNAVDEPTGLMSAANMQLIVRDVSAGHKVGNHCQRVGPAGARGLGYLDAIHDRRRGRRIGRRSLRRIGDVDGLFCSGNIQREVQDRL